MRDNIKIKETLFLTLILSIFLFFNCGGDKSSNETVVPTTSPGIVVTPESTPTPVPTVVYVDIANLPKIASKEFCDLSQIDKVSRFRSGTGHNYADDFEQNRSMKHYYEPTNYATRMNNELKLYSPIEGIVDSVVNESSGNTGALINKQVRIKSGLYPTILIVLFHVDLISADIAVGKTVTPGEQLGYAHMVDVNSDLTLSHRHNFDIAVKVTVSNGIRKVSYIDLMTDDLFNAYIPRGATARKDFIITKEERDSDPLALVSGSDSFVTQGTLPNWVDLN